MESKDLLGSSVPGRWTGPRWGWVLGLAAPGLILHLVHRGDAQARAGRVGLRGLPFLQARHPQGADRTDLDDRAEEGESLGGPSRSSEVGMPLLAPRR